MICGLGVYDIEMKSLMNEVSILPVATEKKSSYPVIVEAVHDSSGGVALLSQVKSSAISHTLQPHYNTVVYSTNSVITRSRLGSHCLPLLCTRPSL